MVIHADPAVVIRDTRLFIDSYSITHCLLYSARVYILPMKTLEEGELSFYPETEDFMLWIK